LAERLDAGACQPVAALRRLVRVGRCADRDGLPLPGRPRELTAQHLGDVRLDPDARAVALVRRPVGPRLERADVAERAPVGTAHVRVERPGERHAADSVEGAAARFLAVLGAHRGRIANVCSPCLGATGAVPILRPESWTRTLLVPTPSG